MRKPTDDHDDQDDHDDHDDQDDQDGHDYIVLCSECGEKNNNDAS